MARSKSDKYTGKAGAHTPPSSPFDTHTQSSRAASQPIQSFQSFVESNPKNASQTSLPLFEDVDLVDPVEEMQPKKASKWTLNTKTSRKVDDDYEVVSPTSANPFESEAEKAARWSTGHRKDSNFSEAI